MRRTDISGSAMIAMMGTLFGLTGLSVSHADEVRVLATGVYDSSLHDSVEPFKQQSGHNVRLTMANAGGVLSKMEAGDPADVVMTSSAGIDTLSGAGRVVRDSKVDVGRMRLGAAIRPGAAKPDLSTADKLCATLLAASATAYIDPMGGGTSGSFFEKMFDRLGVANGIHANGVPCATGIDVAKAVATGKASIGLTQVSELMGAEGVEFVGFLPDDMQLITVYSAALSNAGNGREAAKEFLRFVTGPVGAERFKRSGWDVSRR